MKIEQSNINMLTITDLPNLDPIRVMTENYEPGQGRITITCWDESWVNYWGSMAGRTIEQFFMKCSVDYLAGKLACGMRSDIYDPEQAEVECRKAIIAQRRSKDMTAIEARDAWDMVNMAEWPDDPGYNADLFSAIFGDEWWYQLPEKVNPKYAYLCQIIGAVKEALVIREAHVKQPDELAA